MTFLSDTVAVSIVDSHFVSSNDGGVNWTVGAAADGRSNLLPVSAEVVLAWGRAGSFPNYDDRIFRSADGGQNWTDLGEVMNPGAFAASFGFAVPNPQTVVATDGAGNMIQSTDAGLTWNLIFSSPPSLQPGFLSNAAPVFGDAQTGYFGYGPGFVIKTTDGGASWSQISSGTGQTLNDVARFASDDLIAVGDNGTVVSSDSGLAPWIMHPSFSQYHLKAVHMVGLDEVVTLDEVGQVYLSADGGANWTAAGSVPAGLSPAEDLHFTTLLDGWVIGQGGSPGVLYHTTDGGSNWTPVPEIQGAYVAVDVEGSSLWALNITGNYYRSIDGGNSWIPGDLPGLPSSVRDLDFYDQGTGYAVGWGGYAARSDDGGASWQVLPVPGNGYPFTDIYLIGPNELWVSTASNLAYYSANGGQNWAVLEIGSTGFGSFNAIVANPADDAWTVGADGYIEHFSGPPPPPLNRPPDASFTFLSSGLTVHFTDTSIDPDGIIVSWNWDFGDSTSSSEQNPTHIYLQANTYIVRLTVTDDDGDSNSTIRIITVQPNPGGTFGDFTEVTPIDSLFVTPQDEDFWVISTAPADYDGDGDLDIAVLGYYVIYNQSAEDRLVLITNQGPVSPGEWDFTYLELPLGSLSTGASDMAWGDVDGDGDQDLAVGTDGQTVIYRNDAGTLLLSDTVLPGYWEENSQAEFDLRSITWADYDNDGDIDLLLPSVYDNTVFGYRTVLMRNEGANSTGGWNFTRTDSVFAPTVHVESAWADFDHDQDLDLLLVHIAPLTENGFIRRYRNDGNGVFVGQDILGALTVEHGEAQWGDYDADGDLDILLAGLIKELDGSFNLALRIYRNDNETYVPLEVIPSVSSEGWFDLTAATWADYDSDGDMDILLAGNYNSGSQIEGRARIYTNSGGTFISDSLNTLPAPRASGDRGGTFSWLDLDGDGDLDYFIAGQYFVPGGNGLVEAQMHIYRNDSQGQNTAPTAPANLTSAVQPDSSVILSWVAAGDDHTPAAALTYDLDLFRDGVPVAIPHRLPEPGNVSAVTEWLLTALPEGQYYWNLQAVDAAYTGGPVAAGQFVIGDQAAIDPAVQLPGNYTFDSNYPNPFNPVTTFSFALPEQTRVELAVYNLNGQLVTRLVNGVLPGGVHQVQWDASGLASGTYFVRLSTPAYTRS